MGDNYFGGASQFAGGGFMPSPAVGNENAYGGGAGGKRSGGGRKEETIRAVTLKQILQDCVAEEDVFMLDNAPVTNVSIVARIVDVQENATRIVYKVHDNTGTLDLNMHLSGGEEDEVFQSRKRELVPNTYVRAYGTLRTFQNQVSMTVYNIRPLQDFNELAYHNLQVIFQHLHLLRGPAAAAPTAPSGPAAYGAPYQAGAPGQGAFMAGGATPANGAAPAVRTGDPNQDVLSVFNNPANRDAAGLNFTVVEQQLRNQGMHYTMPQIKAAVEFLVNEGHLYSTIDENHFKSCQ